MAPDAKSIHRAYTFRNFKEVMLFVNAVAFIAEQERHHPDIALGYNYCNLTFTTHDTGGVSEKDFSCAAKVNLLSGDA